MRIEVNNVVDYLVNWSQNLVAKCLTPLSRCYCPEVDVTGELDTADVFYYHSLIGILRWIVDLVRIYITCEVSMMSSHLALPREGNFKEVFHVFDYFKKHMNSELVFAQQFQILIWTLSKNSIGRTLFTKLQE